MTTIVHLSLRASAPTDEQEVRIRALDPNIIFEPALPRRLANRYGFSTSATVPDGAPLTFAWRYGDSPEATAGIQFSFPDDPPAAQPILATDPYAETFINASQTLEMGPSPGFGPVFAASLDLGPIDTDAGAKRSNSPPGASNKVLTRSVPVLPTRETTESFGQSSFNTEIDLQVSYQGLRKQMTNGQLSLSPGAKAAQPLPSVIKQGKPVSTTISMAANAVGVEYQAAKGGAGSGFGLSSMGGIIPISPPNSVGIVVNGNGEDLKYKVFVALAEPGE